MSSASTAPADAAADDESSDDEIQRDADPLYDEAQDDADEKWVSKRFVKSGRVSDAVLSCPACFTNLCFDCQRHDVYKTQYRAMFVQNCRVDLSADAASAQSTERPVFCSDCGTHVAMMDSDEVYHFFNALPSAAGGGGQDTSEFD